MDVIAERTAESDLIVERAGQEWLAGEAIRAMAPVSGLDLGRWKVRGLKQAMVPEVKHGPRFVQIGFADASWARVKTDESGLAALVPPLSHSGP